MGTRVAPSLANVFMNWFEEKFVYTYKFQPYIWLRFLDDVFCIWPHGTESLHDFHCFLNSCHKSIKSTMENSTESISFLDTLVYTKDRTLLTDLYTKPTDSHNYLLFSSSHPLHIKESIPYSQFLRIRRICNENDNLINHCIEISKHFIRREYPTEIVAKGLLKAASKN